MSFKPVESNPNFVELEHQVAEYWKENNIVKKYLEKNKDADKKFFFLDGPVTANNPLGVHHAWGRTLKDIFQRFNNMMGYEQRFQNGFDCQGLWVEVEVEKELGFKTKKDIETYGIDRFVNKCKDRVRKYSGIQTEQSKRLGYFMDWDNSYYTMSDENNYMIWHFLKVCNERNWLYKGWDSVPWCARCGTAISQHEILTEEYKELSHLSVFVKLPLLSEKFKQASLLVWTTTPWTLPANVAAAVHPELKYSIYKNKENNERYIFIDDTEASEMLFLEGYVDVHKLTKERTFLGEELVGVEYKGLFDEFDAVKKANRENSNKFHTVIAAKDLVNANEGTGIVHIAPGCGKEDYDLSNEGNFSKIKPIDAEANYVEGFGFLTNKNVKETNTLIFESLEDKGLLYKIQKYTHRYPTCWRCKEELVFRLVEEWYIAMDREDPTDETRRTLRQEMIDVAKMITWIPDFGLDRELDWLNNMHDWLISKKRYWGLALPIWKCESCEEFTVIGSKEELQEKAISGWEKFEGNSPHRPWVDEVKVTCEKCGKVATRIKDVGNPWLDAGIVPYSTLVDPKTNKVSYTNDRAYWEKWFPADLVLECFPGQFKNWFYSMIAMSTVLEKTNPYTTLLGHALVRDEHGEEMHKSSGNAIWFDDAAEEMGVDVIRWMYSLQPTSLNMKFGYSIANDTRRRFHLVIWNIYNFFVTYASLDNWEPQKNKECQLTVLDKWILERLDQTTYTATKFIKNHQTYLAAQAIDEFVQDLSTWYLRRSRKRVGPAVLNGDDKDAFYATMHQTLLILMRLIAPFVPFMSDTIYQNLTQEESVHLATWPIVEKKDVSNEYSDKMTIVRQVVEKGHALRKEQKMKVRQPLQSVTYKVETERLEEDYEKLLLEELNVKSVIYEKKSGELEVVLDFELSEELKKEGLAREFIRFAQQLRKELGCEFDDTINVYYQAGESVQKVVQEFEQDIKSQIISEKIENLSKDLTVSLDKKIEEEPFWMGVELAK